MWVKPVKLGFSLPLWEGIKGRATTKIKIQNEKLKVAIQKSKFLLFPPQIQNFEFCSVRRIQIGTILHFAFLILNYLITLSYKRDRGRGLPSLYGRE
jgi:hypothetical protein